MKYVNPIEILQLQNYSVFEIDSLMIRKAKRKLFADIELSDNGHYEYKGGFLTKSDCEIAIDECGLIYSC
jgi:hypothetical protein